MKKKTIKLKYDASKELASTDEVREFFLKKLDERDESIALLRQQIEQMKKEHEYELKQVKGLLVEEFTYGFNTCKKVYGIKDPKE